MRVSLVAALVLIKPDVTANLSKVPHNYRYYLGCEFELLLNYLNGLCFIRFFGVIRHQGAPFLLLLLFNAGFLVNYLGGLRYFTLLDKGDAPFYGDAIF